MRKYYHHNYYVLEIFHENIYQYYLGKQQHGDLMHMYGTLDKCFPCKEQIESYIRIAIKTKFWR